LLAPAVAFWQVILAVHIAAVVVAFGVVFAYPLFALAGKRADPRAMPWFHRMQQMIGRRLTSPGLGVILVAGIYLASDLHQWHRFYVQWAVVVVIVLGALEGAVMGPREGRLAELAERDIAAAGDGDMAFSQEYDALTKQVGTIGTVMTVLVLITIYLMSVQA
jgi:hypothetical protein